MHFKLPLFLSLMHTKYYVYLQGPHDVGTLFGGWFEMSEIVKVWVLGYKAKQTYSIDEC